MSADNEMRREIAKVTAMAMDVFVDVAAEAHRSIQSGSELTGAPGQPVDTGNLRASWQLSFPTPTLASIDTNVEYAEAIEDGVGPHGPLTLRSAVGGFHSVSMAAANMQRVADEMAKRRAAG